MHLDEYKTKLFDVIRGRGKLERGVKYIRHWDHHWLEKNYVADTVNLDGITTALDVGTGVGVLAYVLQQKGVHVEGSDIDEETTGPIFKQCCDIIGMRRHYLKIEPQKPMQIGNYDLFIATRTEFDRQFVTAEDWLYFINDAFKHFKRIFIKFNVASKSPPPHCPPELLKYMWLPRGLGKPRRAWYLQLDREQWQEEVGKP